MTEYQGKNIEEWLKNIPQQSFPQSINYYNRYCNIKEWLINNIYNDGPGIKIIYQ